MKRLLGLLIAMPLIAWANPNAPMVVAESPMATEVKEAAPPPPKKKAPAPYTLPFHLRPIAASNVVRLDNVLGLYDASGDSVKVKTTPGSPAMKGMKEVSILNAGYKFATDLGILARIGVANNFPSTDVAEGVAKPKNGYALTNGLLFVTYTPSFVDGDLRTAFYLGVTAPIGSGGGTHGDATARTVNATSMMVRSAMDNALFAVNDVAVIPGVDIAYVKYGLTVQLEATYLEIMRARADTKTSAPAGFYQTDVVKRNLVAGLFVGYSIIPQLSAGVEVRYQRWLKPPHAIRDLGNKEHTNYSEKTQEQYDTRIQNLAVALGLRGNFKIGEKTFFRPAISYAMGLMGEIGDQKYHLIQVDLPFAL